ncbi:uncharacterized protein LOC127850612 isoform X3 [Dreissena polymorpha]|uniref:uncharacterized protein LOC127850612 isoform X3 n=2 Tax=Dreissena polymorpha TaxID=45954 RepID=UPI0022655B27|nr:uncharacterized protein LOC127850612 isoform X3 [Dreissena polymorpha]XP_052239717.1 uncharacterized protein LOC127850612 isoform X3 [Dreissena polymorpha]XP_052239719.1 uncharacterized protein LOC127850612 isoform X3 [Dreissena polymorpha]
MWNLSVDMEAAPRESRMQNKESDIGVRRASNKKRYQNLQSIMQIPEHFTELSIRMFDTLDDSGAGKETLLERRRTYLRREQIEKITYQIKGLNRECFHFGSQSEGTTTPGLQSDIDFLYSNHTFNIMTIWEDWKAGLDNLLMLHDNTTPPQQYLLQDIQDYTPEPATSLTDDRCVRKDSGQILFSAERWKQHIEYETRHMGEATKNGPSVSVVPNWDIVQACHIRKPLPEIQHWIDRCRGKHWPPVQLLEAARIAPCFLVPAGHPDSDYKREEWRLSPNLIERMLMFSFNMTQIKCYIVLKLIKKSLFANIVGDAITSFHCKTLMFFTIERTHPSLWCDHNLMFVLLLCLHVLRQCLRLGRLPHYIIEGVNLFDGKLSKLLQTRLLVYIDSLIRNNLQDVFCIGIDNISCRLQACSMRHTVQAGELRGVFLHNSIRLLLKFEYLQTLKQSHTTFEHKLKYVICNCFECFEKSRNAMSKTAALELIKHFYALHISVQSSYYLRLQNVLDCVNIRRVQYSLNSDVASSRLKFASMLYCSGHLQAAVRVLEDVERRYHSEVKAVCIVRRLEGDRDLKVFANMLAGNKEEEISELPFAFCVRFVRQESYCTPAMLLFEMNRNITQEEVANRLLVETLWMDSAEVDARPFLYYMQYITYGGLGERDKQLHAMGVLEAYIDTCIRNQLNLYHLETALNLLGHCYEMEGDYAGALDYYELSLSDERTNNAANWHILRIMRLISG